MRVVHCQACPFASRPIHRSTPSPPLLSRPIASRPIHRATPSRPLPSCPIASRPIHRVTPSRPLLSSSHREPSNTSRAVHCLLPAVQSIAQRRAVHCRACPIASRPIHRATPSHPLPNTSHREPSKPSLHTEPSIAKPSHCEPFNSSRAVHCQLPSRPASHPLPSIARHRAIHF